MNTSHWVTIDRHLHPTDAHIAAGRLEASGIAVNLLGIHHASVNWLVTPALGGIRLQVPAADVERAREILSADYSDELEDPERCPRCGSDDIGTTTNTRRLSFLAVHLFSIPLPWGKSRRKCQRCGATWEESGEAT